MFSWLFRLRIGQICADDWRCLGEPVAFVDFFVEALFKMAGKIERQLFGAGDDEAQAAKLMRLSLAQVHPQKSGRHQKEC